ncbi:hypothetical protein BHE74_00004975 [Ensete ventricosum]|nr:hypothetical protein GW17_00060135 [Ensete ventricosum]RWW86252.1 hypothetical protein BHE74_00004975 [Ensete ventricosum]
MSVTGHSYLRSLLPLSLTMLSYLSTTPVVLAVRCAFFLLQLWRVDLTHVRSAVQSLTPPCLCQVYVVVSGWPHWRYYRPRARGRGSQVNICHIIPLEKTFLRCPIRVLKMKSCAELWVCNGVKLVPKAYPTE